MNPLSNAPDPSGVDAQAIIQMYDAQVAAGQRPPPELAAMVQKLKGYNAAVQRSRAVTADPNVLRQAVQRQQPFQPEEFGIAAKPEPRPSIASEGGPGDSPRLYPPEIGPSSVDPRLIRDAVQQTEPFQQDEFRNPNANTRPSMTAALPPEGSPSLYPKEFGPSRSTPAGNPLLAIPQRQGPPASALSPVVPGAPASAMSPVVPGAPASAMDPQNPSPEQPQVTPEQAAIMHELASAASRRPNDNAEADRRFKELMKNDPRGKGYGGDNADQSYAGYKDRMANSKENANRIEGEYEALANSRKGLKGNPDLIARVEGALNGNIVPRDPLYNPLARITEGKRIPGSHPGSAMSVDEMDGMAPGSSGWVNAGGRTSFVTKPGAGPGQAGRDRVAAAEAKAKAGAKSPASKWDPDALANAKDDQAQRRADMAGMALAKRGGKPNPLSLSVYAAEKVAEIQSKQEHKAELAAAKAKVNELGAKLENPAAYVQELVANNIPLPEATRMMVAIRGQHLDAQTALAQIQGQKDIATGNNKTQVDVANLDNASREKMEASRTAFLQDQHKDTMEINRAELGQRQNEHLDRVKMQMQTHALELEKFKDSKEHGDKTLKMQGDLGRMQVAAGLLAHLPPEAQQAQEVALSLAMGREVKLPSEAKPPRRIAGMLDPKTGMISNANIWKMVNDPNRPTVEEMQWMRARMDRSPTWRQDASPAAVDNWFKRSGMDRVAPLVESTPGSVGTGEENPLTGRAPAQAPATAGNPLMGTGEDAPLTKPTTATTSEPPTPNPPPPTKVKTPLATAVKESGVTVNNSNDNDALRRRLASDRTAAENWVNEKKKKPAAALASLLGANPDAPASAISPRNTAAPKAKKDPFAAKEKKPSPLDETKKPKWKPKTNEENAKEIEDLAKGVKREVIPTGKDLKKAIPIYGNSQAERDFMENAFREVGDVSGWRKIVAEQSAKFRSKLPKYKR